MKIPRRLFLLFCICLFTLPHLFAQQQPISDSVVIPFEYKQSALYQPYTLKVLDSVVEVLLVYDSVTLSIDGYAHLEEGSDTITKYLSLNRALFIRTYILGRGIDTSKFISVKAHGKTRQLYRGTVNMGLGNCRAVVKLHYPMAGKVPKDSDGDRIVDSVDICPNAYGEKINKGCPDTSTIIVPFENQQASLHAKTYKVLDSIIKILKNNPTYTFRIVGHAYKTEGSSSVVNRIAKERAEIVKQYFLSRYIGASRIEAVEGVGAGRNITAGRNPGEIARNWRAEIYLNRHN